MIRGKHVCVALKCYYIKWGCSYTRANYVLHALQVIGAKVKLQ